MGDPALAAQIRPMFHCSLGEMRNVLSDPARLERKLLRKWLAIAGLLLLCLIWAVGWVRADLQPGTSGRWSVTPLMNQAALLGSLALAAAAAALVRRVEWPGREFAGKAGLVGVGLFVIPTLLTGVARDRIDDATRVALFSLTPLFAVIFEPHLGIHAGKDHESRGGFLAAMTAIAGTFLVFPVELPRSYGAAFLMIGVVGTAAWIAGANCTAVRMTRQSPSVLTFTTVVSGLAALALEIFGLGFRQHAASGVFFNGWTVLDLVALALLFWLMPRMSAVQMTTRYLIAPLMANLMSLALLRPHVDIQSWIGLLLIAAGAGWLMFAPAKTGDSDDFTLLTR